MITVNLRPGQKRRRRAGNPFAGLLNSFSGLKELGARVKDPLLMGAVGAWVFDAARHALAFQKNGRTIDIQENSRYLRPQEPTPWIEDVKPDSAQSKVDK